MVFCGKCLYGGCSVHSLKSRWSLVKMSLSVGCVCWCCEKLISTKIDPCGFSWASDNSFTPTGCPTTQLNSDANYPELVQAAQVWSVFHKAAPFQTPASCFLPGQLQIPKFSFSTPMGMMQFSSDTSHPELASSPWGAESFTRLTHFRQHTDIWLTGYKF